uniref:Syntaxin 6/10/61 N-terminal domain-containing protein n=1 Tax=Picea sitchensis TaxID=3332 RepID=B8LQV3_PICSI|nr:unknown [Picea sitchensis]
MASDLCRWEVDPFFSAAEDVQDSADRMESAYRTWLHDQSLGEPDPADMELVSLIEIRKRELITALGTAKWQLEDFERAIRVTASTNKAYSKEDAPSRHMQFIGAIQNQIASIEKELQDSIKKDGNRSLQWVDLDDRERDDLAMFLSGGGSLKNTMEHGMCRNITEQQSKGSIGTSANLRDTEDMVELRLDDTQLLHPATGQSKLQCTRHSRTNGACVLDTLHNGFTETEVINKDSEFVVDLAHKLSGTRDDCHSGDSLERATGHKRSASAGAEFRAWKIVIADNDIGKRSYDSRCENFDNGLNFWGYISNLKFMPKLNFSKSGMKRWKDGEGSSINRSKHDQMVRPSSNGVLNTWSGGNNTISNGYHLHSDGNSEAKQLHGWTGGVQRRFQRSQCFIEYSRLHPARITSAILVMLGLLGLFTFHVT